MVRDLNAPKQEKSKTEIAPDLQQLTQRFTDRFSANVKIDHNKQGKGKLTIHYHSLEELGWYFKYLLSPINFNSYFKYLGKV